MQSVCALLPAPHAERVVDARARLSEEPAIGAIYDPPFVHFTLQLAEEYDWDGLAVALKEFAKTSQPFEMRTVGLLVDTGNFLGAMVAPYKDRAISEFQAAAWEVITPHAQGRVDQFYHPEHWLPHVTVKRMGSDPEAFGRGLAKLATEDFHWTATIDSIAVQHDPGKNSQTHYQRLYFSLGSVQAAVPDQQPEPNATIVGIVDGQTEQDVRTWTAEIRHDDGSLTEATLDAPAMVRLMAAAKASFVHFTGARCRMDVESLVSVTPNTPFPVM